MKPRDLVIQEKGAALKAASQQPVILPTRHDLLNRYEERHFSFAWMRAFVAMQKHLALTQPHIELN